jgi:hypothetical protein
MHFGWLVCVARLEGFVRRYLVFVRWFLEGLSGGIVVAVWSAEPSLLRFAVGWDGPPLLPVG